MWLFYCDLCFTLQFLLFQNLCPEDEYTVDSTTYSLDYRPVDGDVSREQNALATANFKPHGKS